MHIVGIGVYNAVDMGYGAHIFDGRPNANCLFLNVRRVLMQKVMNQPTTDESHNGVLDRQRVFDKMCFIRHFDRQVIEAVRQERVPGAFYLAIGQEATPATISELTQGFTVFTQHRCHSTYLAYGGDPGVLRDELLGLESGCCQGAGGSPSIHDPAIPMYPYHGLIGENIPLAVGYALATKRPTAVYFGDGASEEDYALTAFGFAATHQLPILFVCEDNGLSILTKIEERRSWKVLNVAKSMRMQVAEIEDDPDEIFQTVQGLLPRLPAFINIKTCRHHWHAGIGVDGPPERDRLKEYAPCVPDAQRIEQEAMVRAERLWRGETS